MYVLLLFNLIFIDHKLYLDEDLRISILEIVVELPKIEPLVISTVGLVGGDWGRQVVSILKTEARAQDN